MEENTDLEFFNDTDTSSETVSNDQPEQTPTEAPQPAFDLEKYNQLQQVVNQQGQIIEGFRNALGGQAPKKPDPVETLLNDIVNQKLEQGGYLTNSAVELRETVKGTGFVNTESASSYYASQVHEVLGNPNSTPQDIAQAEKVLELWGNPQTQARAIQLAAKTYGAKGQGSSSQPVGQSQTFGNPPGVHQQQNQKPFSSESEMDAAFYDPKHPKHKLAVQVNSQMARGDLQTVPY